MEATKKDQTPRSADSSGSKMRYELRASGRLKPAAADPSESPASRRKKPSSTVSQSVDGLGLSAKGKSAKPPRRLSIPTKAVSSPRQAPIGSITPISETRSKRSNVQGKSDTPLSETSMSAGRRKFCVLSSVSYWLTQIKLSESVSMHSVSLGFFKLALESGCEPLQRIRDELKSYVRRHNLLFEFEHDAKDLLQSYNILEDFEKLRLENTPMIQDDKALTSHHQKLNGSSSSAGAGNLKPKSLISNGLSVADKKEIAKRVPAPRDNAFNNKNQRHPVSVKDVNANVSQKKSQKPREIETKSSNTKVKGSANESAMKEASPAPAGEEVSWMDGDMIEDKENKDSMSMDAAVLTAEIQTK